MQHPGISGIAIYVPCLRVGLEPWSLWRGQDWAKVRSVVGSGFRICEGNENAYTMAASAVLQLIDAYDIDPNAVGMLVLGTESSTDNAVGAAIVRGLVDTALFARGSVPLASDCEVPEVKQACLAGVYGLKQAIRWLQTDGRGRVAIVVASDIAEYELHSSGEQTQGAGAVAMLVDEHADLLMPMLDKAGSSSRFRGMDFRKPVLRHLLANTSAPQDLRARDFPVFNGKYSTHCYVDAVLRAFATMCVRRELRPIDVLVATDRIFMHRPYSNMPRQGASWLATWALLEAVTLEQHDAATAIAVDFAAIDPGLRREAQAELAALVGTEPRWVAPPSVCVAPRAREQAPAVMEGRQFHATSAVAAQVRAAPEFGAWARRVMGLGSTSMQECGNLYSASLPAWLAAGLEEAVVSDLDIAGECWLAVGYGSGDAAECIPMQVSPRWRDAAAKIHLAQSFSAPVELSLSAYEHRHGGGLLDPVGPQRRPFEVGPVGRGEDSLLADSGVESYLVRTAGSEAMRGRRDTIKSAVRMPPIATASVD